MPETNTSDTSDTSDSGKLIIPLIMCGGAGTRLWPASREARPKQFLRLLGKLSTFQETILRVSDPMLFGRPVVVTNVAYRFMVQEQLKDIAIEADIILEPVRRDSAPGLAVGALFALKKNPNVVMLALAADHVIADNAAFVAVCRNALNVATSGYIVTFGIRPDRPAVEYGYIRPGALLTEGAFKVEKFVEKPDKATAEKYIQDGYLWNSGNFMFPAKVLMEEYRKSDSNSVKALEEAVNSTSSDLGFVTLNEKIFSRAKGISIDYAVMEPTSFAAVIPVSYAWSDVGSWRAVWELTSKDDNGNATLGAVVLEDVQNCNVISEKSVVALEGIADLNVVVTEDAVLVSGQKDAGSFKKMIQKPKLQQPQVTEDHPQVYRPWGSYQSLDIGVRHQVKLIVVKPGARLSLQKHFHRSEHWIVVRGTAVVTVDETVRTIHENESIYIPMGAVHRMENPGKIPLELIEVQTGSYLGEDDIVRVQDDYRRE